ncbi:hypothetical protein [Flavobacterium sp.]|uniref:hypothetical protein n=1 Tax=Flavobacterium sp. TaxID=239 RepID=UPI0025BA0773|nr:hypothetical protein [Flavobacterium sp.]
MSISLSIAKRLVQLLNGEKIASSQLKNVFIEELMKEQIISSFIQGRSKSSLYVSDPSSLISYLKNHYGINDLNLYIATLEREDLIRADSVQISSDSKIKSIRTFKGFLVSSFEPIEAYLNGYLITINPPEGSFSFIYDFESFVLNENIVVVGIENPENFRFISKQSYLFPNQKILFVCRYPHSHDLIKWLMKIPNQYIHYGDFDFAGLRIYLYEYKVKLGEKASFFIPDKIEYYIEKYGSLNIYNTQIHLRPNREMVIDENVDMLLKVIDVCKKGLEQEIFINNLQK